MEKLKNILVVAITRMGDMLQASPTIVGLKKENPNSHITVVIEKQFAAICEGIPCIDEVYEIDLGFVCKCLHHEKEGIVDAYAYLDSRIAELKSRNFDFCLNMSSSAYTALLLKMLEIKDCRGWVSDEEGHRIISSPWAMLFSAFVYHSNRDYNSINIVDIFRCCAGVKEHPLHLVYDVTANGEAFVEEFLQTECQGGSGPVICIQAGASQEKRQWSPARFAYLTELLIEKHDAKIIFTGSKSELNIIDAIVSRVKSPNVAVAAGRTNFEQLSALLKRADVLITGDTGPMHLAVAVGTPVVSLFLASALCFETGPYSEGNFVIQPQISCNPCNPNFPCARPDCHDQISPKLVADLTKIRLETKDRSLTQVRIPEDMADPNQVAVYVTTFDQHNFLDFKQVNGESPRKGRSGQYYAISRETYRDLWKEEFEGAPLEPVKFNGTLETPLAKENLAGIDDTLRLTVEGKKLIEKLVSLIRDVQSPPQLLGQINSEIEKIDKVIEEVGLCNPILGALTRMFVMEKENMRGSDPLLLASETKKLYERLAQRSKRFGQLFQHHETQIKN